MKGKGSRPRSRIHSHSVSDGLMDWDGGTLDTAERMGTKGHRENSPCGERVETGLCSVAPGLAASVSVGIPGGARWKRTLLSPPKTC